ncbi:MAG: hypothetical protein ABIP79_08240 [Chitinophagaceae bacterium]
MPMLNKLTLVLLIFGFPLFTHAQTTTKNKVLFSSKPFSTNPASQKDFKANSTIYSRLIVEKTLRDYAIELDTWGLKNVSEDGLEGKYTHCVIVEIKDQNTGKEDHVPTEISIYLSESDLSKNQLDIDIAPDKVQAGMYFYGSRATFFNQFSSLRDEDSYIGKVINFQLVLNQYKKNETTTTHNNPTDFSYNDAYSKINEKASPSGFITIDYTESSKETQKNWYNEQAAILDATRELIINNFKNEQANQPSVAVSKTIKENKISFAATPFSANTPLQVEFKVGSPIYGRIKLDKPLKNYSRKLGAYELEKFGVESIYSDYIVFEVDPIDASPERGHSQITLYLKPGDLAKNTIDFDVMPEKNAASTFFGTGFYSELADGKDLYNYFGKKIEMKISIAEESKNSNPEVKTILGSLIMDYSDSDYRSISDLSTACKEIENNIQKKYKK